MSAFKMTVSDSHETTSVMTTLQMVFGCVYQFCGDVVEIYASPWVLWRNRNRLKELKL